MITKVGRSFFGMEQFKKDGNTYSLRPGGEMPMELI
jgi:hypothetical protein